MPTIEIKGRLLNKALLNMVTDRIRQANGGQITCEDAKDLIGRAIENRNLSAIDSRTLAYIRVNYNFTDEAAQYFDRRILTMHQQGYKNND